MQIGRSCPASRRRRTTAMPSSSGMVTSRTITAGGRAGDLRQRGAAVGRRGHGEALEAQRALEGLA
jgi:hypothetical protein